MKWCERILLFLFLGICLGIMSEGTLRAGDCASPGDCGAVPDNGSRAAAAGAAAAGGGLAWRSHNKNKNKSKKKGGSPSPPGKPDPCASQKSAMTQAQSTANMYQSQMDTY